ncbi:uncharacterized protein LOC106471410 [Limulus polyphemus]|uniref:Uncharacterized protein LOC106471410 n=1 Tax=Limulus polyphemus TaxID=6850 RepID=A0ABM1BRW0_LIMPO|nr:uncharacterized protein LOC106471410 [Limulus polyphemus]
MSGCHKTESLCSFDRDQRVRPYSLKWSSLQEGHEVRSYTPGSPDLSHDSSSDNSSILVHSQEDITSDFNFVYTYYFEKTDAFATVEQDYEKCGMKNVDDSEDDLDHIKTHSQSPPVIRNTCQLSHLTSLDIDNIFEKAGNFVEYKINNSSSMKPSLQKQKHNVRSEADELDVIARPCRRTYFSKDHRSSYKNVIPHYKSVEVNAYSQPDDNPCTTPARDRKNLHWHLSEESLQDESSSLADKSPYLDFVNQSFCEKWIPYTNLPWYNSETLMSLEPRIDVIDTHCHLDFLFQRSGFKGTYAEYQSVNKDTYPICYGGCITNFCDPSTFGMPTLWQDVLKDDKIWTAFGCHPRMAEQYNPEIEMHLIGALRHDRVVALGEVGLDYSPKNSCERKIQRSTLRKQLKIAVDRHIPVVIHSRDADTDCIKILKEEVPYDHFIHRQCFTGDWNEARMWLNTFPNLYLGLTALVTYPSAVDIHEVARKVPLDRLLIETDAPYFLPRLAPPEMMWSHPGLVIHVAAQIAELRPTTSLNDVLEIVRKNTRRIYGI